MNDLSNVPPIPKIRDEELRHAVSALAQAGDCYRQVFLMVLQGADPSELLSKHLNVLKYSDVVIEKFLEEFEDMDFDNGLNEIDLVSS